MDLTARLIAFLAVTDMPVTLVIVRPEQRYVFSSITEEIAQRTANLETILTPATD